MGGSAYPASIHIGIVSGLAAVAGSGCVTPLSAGRSYVAIGAFHQTDVPEHAGVRSRRVNGLGLVFRTGGMSLGYASLDETSIDPDAARDGVLVVSPGWTAATGAKAERIAASPDAVRAFFLDPSAAPTAHGVLP